MIFIYGFSKNEKSSLEKEELKYFKKFAKDLLNIKRTDYDKLIKIGSFYRIEELK